MKQRRTLSLDSEAVRRGEIYSKLHGTTVSRLVNNFLLSLPTDEDDKSEMSPAVRRLVGAASTAVDVEDYHDYLVSKYGSR